MAKIQIPFDQVMHFGDLHGDIGRELELRRSVFNLDGRRLDVITDAFQLARSTGNEHFAGHTIEYALNDASQRAQRVANSLIKTSSQIFRQANSHVDDSFDWGGAIWEMVRGPGASLAEFIGGKLGDVLVGMGAVGKLSTPLLAFVGPGFILATGVLSLADGVVQLFTAAGDVFEYIAGGLKVIAGGIGVVVGGLAVTFAIVGPATVAAFLSAPFVLGILAVGAVAGVIALAIDYRKELAQALGFRETSVETSGSGPAPGGLIPLGPMPKPTIIATFPATGSESVGMQPNGGGSIPLQGTPGVLLQGTQVPGPEQADPSAEAGASGSPASVTNLPASTRSWQEAKEAYDRLVPGYVQSGLMYSDTLGDNRYQCVSWAWFRMRELGYRGPIFSSGTGGRMAGMMGGNDATEPRLGAVVSSSGHVFIVEEVQLDAAGHVVRARYSEMNSGSHPGGSAAPDYDAKGNFIPASADEFRCDHWIVSNGDGSYSREGYSEKLIVANPDYG